MDNKYYTPTIDEFYVGFEYEELSGVDSEMEDWSCKSFDPKEYIDRYGEYTFDDAPLEGWIRVKYLDKEDIESLGFTHIGGKMLTDVMQEFKWFNGKYWIYLTYTRFTNFCVLRISTSVEDGSVKTLVIHSIGIKNKSELKRLLKQLNLN